MQSKKRKTQSYNPKGGTPASPSSPKKPIFKRWWFWLIIVAVVGSLSIILMKDAIAKPDSSQTSATIDTSATTTYTTCQVGETFDANGMHITYMGVETWLPEGETEHPKTGYTFIRLKIAAENKASDVREIYDNEFTCYADGAREVMEYFTDERLKGGFLSPGDRDEGYIYFSVPEDASTIVVEYTSYLTWRNHIAILPVDLAK